MEREQIIKALECCTNAEQCCDDCILLEDKNCGVHLLKNALSLIKELTEENERLRIDNEIKSQKRVHIFDIHNAFDQGRADGVRKMQERLIAEFRKDDRMNYYIRMTLDQIAKEMLEGK